MNRLQRSLRRLDVEFRELGVRWALVGGLAVSIRAEPRTTRDVDVAVAVSDDREAEILVRSLRSRGYSDLPSGAVIEQTDRGRLATVRLVSPEPSDEGLVVDLLFASSGIEPDIVARADRIQVLSSTFVPVARTGHLLALKLLAGRDQDWADLRSLIAVAKEEDLELCRKAIAQIRERGFQRDKDLDRDLERLLGSPEH
ncbi:MAG TPA: nucleotidyl transferase AbiEii/AbiGii toxin family protein [Thermoanaerobaculia bacterium]|nr:nucleotidyl transferase AbiEii/AbiGii toxin family protein [Thermoanaerobaculia bacterium]